MRIQCATYNGHLGQGHSVLPSEDEARDLAGWLSPTLRPSEQGDGTTPDLIAVGFQEMIPLHLALAGFTSTALDLHEDKLRRAIEETYPFKANANANANANAAAAAAAPTRSRWSLVARKSLGGIALLVYSNDETLSPYLDDVQVATAGCGILNVMGNKGAVGVRLKLKGRRRPGEEDSEASSSSWTFVTAHLAAHQNKVERRNRDWQEIVQRLVFVDADDENHGRERNLYETGHLFVFGDLNYRISLTSPRKLAPHVLSHHVSTIASPVSDSSSVSASLDHLLPHDQLVQQLEADKTLHHLREADKIEFAPTYKFVPGTRDRYKSFKKRVPGWCDRILYCVPKDVEEKVEVEMYRSEMDFKASDHKPVTAVFSIPELPASSSTSSSLQVSSSPFPISPTWRRSQLVGRLLDRFIGFVWCIVMLCGFNRDVRLGIFNLISTALIGGAWWSRGGGGGGGGWKLLA